ncbi:Fibronectin type III domain protein [Aspergillus mulundensis]|uniref:Fibronectin type-III domain-containing protein n=1 Tax=Aspergillus mulundensis TaxID=1810919 RepID=A0A3D8SUS1_9EURO|nr:hypothetical protein DSM5745_01842 [Aspergillus mulundensis]RDW90067.1 hypothetical protein DSM5745_01842 [Aspergillus mulundensis]
MALFLAASILWALSWLLYRAWQVCQTSNEVLIEKLGLDIPPPPEVTLEEITAREIRIAWKQPEFHNSIHKHIIQVNGAKVGESKRAETAVEILNLAPGSIYHICVSSISAANFQTPSAVIHVRTKSLPASQSEGNAPSSGPTIRASIPRSTAGLPTPSAPLMAREHSGGPLQKRSSVGRRQSPAAGATDVSHSHPENLQHSAASYDQNEDISLLADRLKNLQHENDAVEKQTTEEEEEHIALLKDLEKQRNELRKRVREKDEASGDLKKHVNKLESVNRTVQSEKVKRERVLQQKEADRKKRKNDLLRWQEQMAQIAADTAQARQEKERLEEEGKKRADEVREKIAKEQAEMRVIDEEIQDKGGRVKKLEDERKGYTDEDGEDGNELDRIDNERARQWEIKLGHLQARYATLVNLHAQAQQQHQEAQERFKWLTSQRAGTAPFSLPPLDLELPSGAAIRPPRRHRSSLNSNVSSPMNFPSLEPFPTSMNYNPPTTSSPTFAPASSFFNINNGMTLPGLTAEPGSYRRGSDFSITNPQMSPRADALLPSDLLGDEESPELPRPILRPRFSDLEETTTKRESFPPNPSSPDSAGSQPASLLGSPEEAQKAPQEINTQTASSADADEAPKSASRRLSGLFNFSRPRGKTLAEEPPLLGTLKQGQSQSFPREMDEIEPIGPRRRRLSYTTSWANPMSLLPRTHTAGATPDSSSDHLPSRRTAISSIFSPSRFGFGSGSSLSKGDSTDFSTGYNQFSPRHDPIDPSSILGAVRRRGSLSPRPSSTFSFDNQLPHPSTDNRHFGWPSADKPGHRSPLGFNWTSPSTWSRAQSRRPSTTHYGSSGHLPLGFSADPDFIDDSFERQGRPLQAPIGTRPSSSHRPITPKLNPAAPTFKTIITGRRSDKKEGNERDLDHEEADTSFDMSFDHGSPSESRASRDSRSLSNFPRDSYESLERMPSATSTDNAGSKESFIRKITRKGSSSKFGSWKDRSGLFSKKGDSSQGDNDEDGDGEGQLAKSIDSTVSSAPSRSSLSFFSRKSKKSDKAASETSERPSERVSEFGDDEIPEEETV